MNQAGGCCPVIHALDTVLRYMYGRPATQAERIRAYFTTVRKIIPVVTSNRLRTSA